MKTFRIAAFLAFISVSAIGIAQREVSGAASSTIDEILKSHSAVGDFNGTALVAREGPDSLPKRLRICRSGMEYSERHDDKVLNRL
jgi:hypothetical protein